MLLSLLWSEAESELLWHCITFLVELLQCVPFSDYLICHRNLHGKQARKEPIDNREMRLTTWKDLWVDALSREKEIIYSGGVNALSAALIWQIDWVFNIFFKIHLALFWLHNDEMPNSMIKRLRRKAKSVIIIGPSHVPNSHTRSGSFSITCSAVMN